MGMHMSMSYCKVIIIYEGNSCMVNDRTFSTGFAGKNEPTMHGAQYVWHGKS